MDLLCLFSNNVYCNIWYRETSFIQKSLDWGDAVWGDQIDPSQGSIYPTLQPQGNNGLYLDLPSGLLLFSKVATSIIDENDKTFPTCGRLSR